MHPYLSRPQPQLPARRRTSFKTSLIDLVRPSGIDHAVSIEKAFALLHWMKETGAAFGPRELTRLPQYDVQNLLGTEERIISLADLQKRFQRALLGRGSPRVDAWREENGISPIGEVRIAAYLTRDDEYQAKGYYGDHDVRKKLDHMLSKPDPVPMAISLNPVHPTLNAFLGTSLQFGRDGFGFVLHHGEIKEDGSTGSAWQDLIATTRKGESFLDTMNRARKVIDCLVEGRANGCDVADMQRAYRPEYVLDQLEELHLAAETIPLQHMR